MTHIPGSAPVSNTGQNSQDVSENPLNPLPLSASGLTAKIDTFSGSVYCETRDEVEAAIAALEATYSDQIDFSFARPTYMGKRWAGSGQGIRGTKVWYSEPSGEEGCKGHQLLFYLGGQVLSAAPHSRTRELLEGFKEASSLQANRIDFALDDYSRAFHPDDLLAYGEAGQYARSGDLNLTGRKKRKEEDTTGKVEPAE